MLVVEEVAGKVGEEERRDEISAVSAWDPPEEGVGEEAVQQPDEAADEAE